MWRLRSGAPSDTDGSAFAERDLAASTALRASATRRAHLSEEPFSRHAGVHQFVNEPLTLVHRQLRIGAPPQSSAKPRSIAVGSYSFFITFISICFFYLQRRTIVLRSNRARRLSVEARFARPYAISACDRTVPLEYFPCDSACKTRTTICAFASPAQTHVTSRGQRESSVTATKRTFVCSIQSDRFSGTSVTSDPGETPAFLRRSPAHPHHQRHIRKPARRVMATPKKWVCAAGAGPTISHRLDPTTAA